MKTIKLFLLVLVLLTLTGCIGAEKVQVETPTGTSTEVVVESLPTEIVEAAPQDEEGSQDEGEEVEGEGEDVEDEASQVSGDQLVSECTLVSSLPDPPQEYAELFSVQEDDHVLGPEDAAITLIEYGDFQ